MQVQTELVIFDCEGVLVDSETLSNRIIVELVAEFGLKLELQEAILLFKGCRMADFIAVLARSFRALAQEFLPAKNPDLK